MAWKKLTEEELNGKKDFENNAEFFNPEKGDILTGTVKVVTTGKYEKLFLVIEDDEGDEWITTQCASLDKQIKKLEIEEADVVNITYNGRAEDEFASHQYEVMKWVDDE